MRGSIWAVTGEDVFCSSLNTVTFFEKHCFTSLGRGGGCGSPRHQQMVPKNPEPDSRPPAALPCTLRHNPAPFPACLPFPVIPGPRQKVAHNTLCLSADSWKVMLNYGCSWVGLKGSFFSPFLSFKIFFLSPMNCITGQPLGFIHQTPVVFRPFPILLPLLPFQDPLAKQGRILMAGCGQGRGYVQHFSQSLPLPVLSPTPRAQTGHGPGDRDPRLL